MNKKKKVFENDFNITEEQMDSLARVLFPLLYDYLASEKGAENDVDTSNFKLIGVFKGYLSPPNIVIMAILVVIIVK